MKEALKTYLLFGGCIFFAGINRNLSEGLGEGKVIGLINGGILVYPKWIVNTTNILKVFPITPVI
jgi:hypothetical protein